MKRALAIAVAVCMLGVAGFGIAIRGSWTATVSLLPTTTLTSDLSLTYTVAGLDITSLTRFGTTGLEWQRFSLAGAFGPFTLAGSMWFDAAPSPAYETSHLTASFDFGGIAVGATVRHWAPGMFTPRWPIGDLVGQTPAALGTGLQYILTTTVAPVEVRARFVDPSTGTLFQDLRVRLTGIPLCCGITYTAELNFTRTGFADFRLTGVNIPLVAGVSFDLGITYSLTAKSLTITPRMAGIGDVCFAVWAGPVFTGGVALPVWEGIRVDGFRIRCALGDCNWLEYVHAFDPTSATIPSAIRDKFAVLTATGVTPVVRENEYLELGFCGAGCCGGRWTVVLRTMFSTATTPTPGIFGITRFVGEVRIPIMTNFTANLDFVMPASAAIAPVPAFSFGWTFTF